MEILKAVIIFLLIVYGSEVISFNICEKFFLGKVKYPFILSFIITSVFNIFFINWLLDLKMCGQ